MYMGLFGHHDGERVIYLDEDVYVFIGDGTGEGTPREAWPAAGTYGPIPKGGAIGRIRDVLDWVGPEIWRAKRRGEEACLTERVATYDAATALLWGADCVEHFARRAEAVDGNVVETLALARAYAVKREYQSETAQRLATEAESILARLRKGGLASLGLGVASRAGELSSRRRPAEPGRDPLRS